ncbi:hypothetical protein TcasGA2_TC034027 [Tribolium castaneum]|uniref:Uncharacterized protein n=1 Tax=Tribolium castaneum TaxID=7070 RepID=A0A139WDS1_TRICA|nr:hypothetical protein TcasGA2_TC034027 [Tribolium castaneum]
MDQRVNVYDPGIDNRRELIGTASAAGAGSSSSSVFQVPQLNPLCGFLRSTQFCFGRETRRNSNTKPTPSCAYRAVILKCSILTLCRNKTEFLVNVGVAFSVHSDGEEETKLKRRNVPWMWKMLDGSASGMEYSIRDLWSCPAHFWDFFPNFDPGPSPDLQYMDRIVGEHFSTLYHSIIPLSLESISEYKTKSSFSTSSLYPSRECSSMESSSSDCTDYAVRSTTETNREEKTLMSPGSSYLSWIESVNSEYFGSATTTTAEVSDVDNKVGEWNNFWLNYNSARSRYLSSPYLSTSNEDRTGDELSDAKSTCSTQREFTEKMSLEQVMLTVDEINEAIKCAQRITEILQNALKRSEHEFDDSKNDSYYSAPYSQHNSVKDEVIVQRERSFSYAMDPQEIQKQKQQLQKNTPQSSSSSCINALLNTGVADILKRVITKRRDVFNPSEFSPVSRASFSDWSSTK